MITKRDLRQYLSLRQESREVDERIRRLEEKLAALDAESDVVACGRKGKKALGTVRITGFPDLKYQDMRRRLMHSSMRNKAIKAEIDEQIDAVEEYINSIRDSEVRRILRFRCLEDKVLSWQQVANRMGGMYTADSCRMILKRFMES